MCPEATPLTTTNLPDTAPAARVAFVGAGPGDPGLLTVRARDYLAAADIVLLDTLHRAEQLAPWTREDVEFVLAAPHTEGGKPLSEAARAKLLVKTAKRFASPSYLVVRLMDGDPSAFSGLAAEALLPRLPSWAAAGIKTGFLGGLTTFSAIVLAQSQQEPAHAALYALLSVVLGLASAGAGVVLGRKVRAA